MITKPDWNIFKAKFSENPQKNFEWMCYLLFCVEFNLSTGIFRYKNQSGIETNPITKENEVIGWQAKFYETTLSEHKSDFIEMLKKSNRDYPNLTKIIFFTNQEWGQGKNQNDPQVKIDVENEANKFNLQIEWRTASFFETPFVTLDNSLIAQYFFSLEKTVIDSIKYMKKHTESLLSEIQTSIVFNEHQLELERSKLLQNLNTEIGKKSIVVLSGEGGVGKTAVIKKLYNELNDTVPFYILKANEFEITNVNRLFGNSNLSDFITIHKGESKKIFVIDSTEKLIDINNTDPFKEFLSALLKNDWKVVFTARSQYLLDLEIHFIDNYRLKPLNFHISKLTLEEIRSIAESYNFDLPNDFKLLDLITNPFYLNEYLKFYTEEEHVGYVKFKDLLWNKIIKKAKPSREQSFLHIAFKRANENHFYVTVDPNDPNLDSLVEDGILGYETAGYFISHDIYEEWALEKIIESEFIRGDNNFEFFKRIGDTLPIRRSFRNWISEKLLLEVESIKEFIEELIEDEQVSSFWKDEVMISVLLCDYSEYFFDAFKSVFLNKDQKLLQRISFLLRISCKEVDDDIFQQLGMKNIDLLSIKYIFTRPKGSGWKSLIEFVFKHLDEIGLNNISFILPVVHDWNMKFKKGETTKLSGLIALKYYQWIIQENGHLSRYDDNKDKILETILYGGFELKTELAEIFDGILTNKSKDHGSPYYHLVELILSKNFEVIRVLPEYVLKLGDLFWFQSNERRNFFHSRLGVEDYFCIDERINKYYPASAYQTPIYWLLKVSFAQTIKFILDFTNKTVESFAKSDFARDEVTTIELQIENKSYKQYICNRIWNIYRGTQVAPNVLESMHMALEKVLFEEAKNTDAEILEGCLLYLLKNSKSASVTAIVVSIVLAYPEKTFNVAIVLFKSKELFFYDTHRMVLDQSAKLNYSIGYGLNYSSKLYQDERIKTCSDKHRTKSLEHIALEYQFFSNKEVSEEDAVQRQKAVWSVLDTFHNELSELYIENESTKTWKLYLARMDRRKMSPIIEEKDGEILISFNPELEPEVREYSESSLRQSSAKMKYTSLKLWAIYRMKKEEQYKQYSNYEDNSKLALKETQDIIAEFERLAEMDTVNNQQQYDYEDFFLFNHSIPAEVCSVLIRDFYNLLNEEDKVFCKDIILDAAASSFTPNYQYQISDGVESAISVLPILIREFPDERDVIKFILLMILFDPHSIGHYADFADFSINAIIKDLWKLNFEDAHSILIGYLTLIPKYESVRKKLWKEKYRHSIYELNENEVLEAFFQENENDIQKIIDNEISIRDVEKIDKLSLESLITAFQLIPLGTESLEHIQLAQEIIFKFANDLTSDEREDEVNYSLKHDFLVKLSNLVLSSAESYALLYLKPFVDNFNSSKFFAEFFEQFILAEDSLKTKDKFWKVWDTFFEKIVELTKEGERDWYVADIIKSYLFASIPWKEAATEWQTFREKDKSFFKEVSRKIGHCPSTLYSLSKLLNSIGSNYLYAGIVWISEMLNKNEVLWDSKLDSNTVYYMENIVKKHIYQKREDIRKWKKQKLDVLVILDYLVEKGSVVGYMLRENIL
ncbi:AVAST type 4 anti-phage nuclease Avs4 [Paenibacillus jiagnxiensis]|uniref:AVAST type 4 anti-phage nuclease Avs4 n=1 Tax=Paenibacillus jiagnxiensis TaxID=3228926 RepID=UPI0033A72A55